MEEPEEQARRPIRRRGAPAVPRRDGRGIVAAAGSVDGPSRADAGAGSRIGRGTQSPIAEENARPGATDWQLTRVRPDGGGFRSPWIEGYCSKQSVRAGETIDIMVSTRSAAAVPGRDLPHGVLRRARGAARSRNSGRSRARRSRTRSPGPSNLPRVPVGALDRG